MMEEIVEAGNAEGTYYRLISGFWRRLLAFVIDSVLLGLLGMLLGAVMFDILAELGGWGRLIGFCLALPYFGLLNSSAGRGQTVGKRIARIEVVDRSGQHIPVGRSVLRFLILGLPFFLNGLLIPSLVMMSPIGAAIGIIVFGFSGAILYLYIFNRRTRQSLHDLLVGTYVVEAVPKGTVAAQPIWKPHLVISGVWFAVVLTLVGLMPFIAQKGIFPGLLVLQRSIESTGYVHAATVTVGKTWTASSGTKTDGSYVSCVVIWRKRPDDYEKAASIIAQIALKAYPDVLSKDTLSVAVTYGYDIGIAHAFTNRTFNYPPKKWQELLQKTHVQEI